MAEANEVGWFTDPYAKHDARWMSQGSPTSLVRDGAVESYDDPPNEPYARAPERIEPSEPANPDDLRRADDPESGEIYDAEKVRDAVQDVLNKTSWTAW